MPRTLPSERFLNAVVELPKEIRRKVYKALDLLRSNPKHPSLQTKQIKGHPGIYEARVDQRYRLTFERLPGDTLKLRTVGRHDETLRLPDDNF